MTQEIHFRGTPAQLREVLGDFVRGLGGEAGDFAPYVRGVKLRVGMVALMGIAEDFVTKSNGGTGADGITWPPLKRETIAQRRTGPGELKALGITGRRERGLLTPAENKRWRHIFATRKAWLRAKFGMSDGAASARAAQIAWTILKSEGAKTKLEVLGGRKVMMLRDSGRLFNSLSPGVEDPENHPLTAEPPAVEEQILRDEPGAVVVGTNVPYAGRQHAQRPFWRPDGSLPPVHEQAVAEAAKSGIVEAAALILRGAA